MKDPNDIAQLLNDDTKKILSNAANAIVNDLMLFDGDIETNDIYIAAEVAKAIDALLKNKTYVDNRGQEAKRYEPEEIQGFLNLQQETLQKIAGILNHLKEDDLYNDINELGKVCFKESWKVTPPAKANVPADANAKTNANANANPDANDELLESENQFILLYKAQSGELAIRFPNEAIRNQFLMNLDKTIIPLQFRDGPQYTHNPEGYTPKIYEGQNNRIYIPSYKALNGEFAINCGSPKNKDMIIKLMGLKHSETRKLKTETCFVYGDGLFTLFQNPKRASAIYFNPKNKIFMEDATYLKINTSTGEVVQKEFKKAKDAGMQGGLGLSRFDLADKPVKIVPQIEVKDVKPEPKVQAQMSCSISANDNEDAPLVSIEFPSKALRDRWHMTLVGVATMLGLAITEDSLVEASKDNPCLLTIKTSLGMGSTGVYLAKQNLSASFHQPQVTRQVAVDFGDEQLRRFVVATLNLTEDKAHVSPRADLQRAVYFKRNVLNQEGTSFVTEFNEEELTERELFLIDDNTFNMGK